MNELNDAERRVFQDLSRPLPPSDLEDRTVSTLRACGLLAPAAQPSRRVQLFKIAAALVLGFGLGLIFHYEATRSGPVVAALDAPKYLLLLHRTGSTAAHAPDRVQEYANWARKNHDHVVAGEKLQATDGCALRTEGSKVQTQAWPAGDSADMIAGYFVIAAPSREQATELARTCPHLKYGGWIELRPIVRRTTR